MSGRLRVVAALVCLLLVGGLDAGVATAPASAASTLLCKGYDGCAKLNMANAGYKAAAGTMWWRMYAGHNCTNYAAYRMVSGGLPNVRPWSGSGNASNWGLANPGRTNAVPAVGAVAWWAANVRPAGSAGHVAYVEQVVTPDEIIVSQDSWGGDFSWARITRAGGSWPSGFVHFNDVPLRNTAKPTVSGKAKVGSRLTASPGTWTPADATIRYQWRADGVNIAKATGSTLQLTTAQQGKKIVLRATASKLGYPTVTVSSATTAAVAPGAISNSIVPTITGEPKVDSALTASPGTWNPAPSALAYQWSADGEPVEGATAPTLVPGPALVGKALSVRVTASKAGYTNVSATSEATAPVAPGTFTVTEPPTLTGIPRPGQPLALQRGSMTPADAEVAVQWLRAGAPVAGAGGSTYRLTTADLGSRIAVRMTLTRPGYTTMTVRTPATRPVRSVPRMRVAVTRPRRGALRFAVTVSAPRVPTVTGTVRIRSRGRTVKELTLRGGSRTTILRGLPSGVRTFTIRYTGSATVLATTVRRTVQVG